MVDTLKLAAQTLCICMWLWTVRVLQWDLKTDLESLAKIFFYISLIFQELLEASPKILQNSEKLLRSHGYQVY